MIDFHRPFPCNRCPDNVFTVTCRSLPNESATVTQYSRQTALKNRQRQSRRKRSVMMERIGAHHIWRKDMRELQIGYGGIYAAQFKPNTRAGGKSISQWGQLNGKLVGCSRDQRFARGVSDVGLPLNALAGIQCALGCA